MTGLHRTPFGVTLAAVGFYLAIGCTSTTTGNEGNLDFSYTADDDIKNFNKPIAAGASLELRIAETDTRTKVDVDDASTSDVAIMRVASFNDDRVIVEGVSDGNVLVEVTARTQSGDLLTDSVNMRVATAAGTLLSHTCEGGSEVGKYFADTDGVLIGYELFDDSNNAVIGYGFHPFEVSGDAELTLREDVTDQAFMWFDIGSATGPATIASTIDDVRLAMEIITPGDIDDIGGPQTIEVRAGETAYAHFWPTHDGTRVCQSEAEVQAASATPDICEVRATMPVDEESDSFLDITGTVAIEGVAFGTCEFTVTYPDGMGGTGVTKSFTAAVGDFPEAANSAANEG